MSDAAFPLSLRGIKRTFVQGDRRLEVLRGVSLDLRPGEIVALVGQSGSGKSTLLHIAGLLEHPDEGEVIVDGKGAGQLRDRGRTALRRRFLGFVYQYHHLLPEFSAIENVMLPQMLNGLSRSEARVRATDLLAMVQLKDRGDHRPGRLSGGECPPCLAGRRADWKSRCLNGRCRVSAAPGTRAGDRHGGAGGNAQS